MKVWGVTDDALRAVVSATSLHYGGNLDLNSGPEKDGRAWRLRIRVRDSSGPGARRSTSGRRMVAACWHAYRDVMRGVFRRNPDARIQTAMADYRGADAFEGQFPDTYYNNAGSMSEPSHYGSLCECEDREEEAS